MHSMRIMFDAYRVNKMPFTSNARSVRGRDGELLYRNTTNFFRPDLDWKKFGNYIKEKYKNVSKINIFNYACSDGSEPMSLVILLREILGQISEKFLPIMAKDIDSNIIYMANSNFVNMDYMDYEVINEHTDGNFNKYFVYPRGGIGIEGDFPVRVRPELSEQIKYSTADIVSDVKNISDKNTILFCRNFWPYIKSSNARETLIQALVNKLQNNGAMVVGNYDEEVDIYKLLCDKGFRQVKDLRNVYEVK